MASTVTWILIADGARARIFANNGPGTGIASATGVDYIADHRPTRDIGADKPGRTQESATSFATGLRVDDSPPRLRKQVSRWGFASR